MKLLDQTTDYYLRNACTIVSLLHIMQFNFWIQVHPNFLMKAAIYFEKLWKWMPKFWAYFSVIYNAFVLELNTKLWLDFEIEKHYISSFIWDTRSYWIWVKNYNQVWKNAETKWELTLDDVKLMKTYTWKSYFHNLVYDGSKWGYIINSAWKKPFKCKLEVLKELQKNNFLYDPMRTIVPTTLFTEHVIQLTRQMARHELNWNLDEYLTMLPDAPEVTKAIELFNYWKWN